MRKKLKEINKPFLSLFIKKRLLEDQIFANDL